MIDIQKDFELYLKQADLVIPDYGCVAKGNASTVVSFNEGKVVIFRQGEIQL